MERAERLFLQYLERHHRGGAVHLERLERLFQRLMGRDKEYLPSWAGGCHGRAAADGRFGERQKGAGKEQGGEARITEDVPGDLNKESFAPCFGRAFFNFLLPKFHNL